MIRLYLDEKSRRKVVRDVLKVFRGHEEQPPNPFGSVHGGIRFYADEEGIYVSVSDIATELPPMLRELPFRKATLVEMLYFSSQYWPGVYEVGDATAIVDSILDNTGFRERIRVSAPTLDELIELYRQLRAYKVKPTEPWGEAPFDRKSHYAKIGQTKDPSVEAA